MVLAGKDCRRKVSRYFYPALAETVAQNTNIAHEHGGWGDDRTESPSAASPWFGRGGQSGNQADAGVSAFNGPAGGTYGNFGWRADCRRISISCEGMIKYKYIYG